MNLNALAGKMICQRRRKWKRCVENDNLMLNITYFDQVIIAKDTSSEDAEVEGKVLKRKVGLSRQR